MTTIQKMMKQVEQQEKKQQEERRRQEEQNRTIENLNLYIPYTFDNVSKEQLRENLNIFGKIKVIDLVSKLDKNNMNYNSAYIYFEHWFPTPENKKVQAQIKQYTKSQNKMHSFRLNYDGNLHWIILENTSPSAHPRQDRKPTLDLKTPGVVSVPAVSVPPPPTPPSFPPPKKAVPSVLKPAVLVLKPAVLVLKPVFKRHPVAVVPIEVSELPRFEDVIQQRAPQSNPVVMKEVFIDDINRDDNDDLRNGLNERQRLIDEMQRIREHDEKMILLQAQEQEQAEAEAQAYYQLSPITQAFYYYYDMMRMERYEMDEITEAMDEEDAWSEYLEQVQEECDFCEDHQGDGLVEEKEIDEEHVDYAYVKMLELELANLRK